MRVLILSRADTYDPVIVDTVETAFGYVFGEDIAKQGYSATREDLVFEVYETSDWRLPDDYPEEEDA